MFANISQKQAQQKGGYPCAFCFGRIRYIGLPFYSLINGYGGDQKHSAKKCVHKCQQENIVDYVFSLIGCHHS